MPSHAIPSYPIPSHPIPSNPITSHPIPSHPIQPHHTSPIPIKAAARRGLASSSAVISRPGTLPPAVCGRLRAAVDAERQQKCDTVDGAPDHQLNLSPERLIELIGDAAASAALWRLPSEWATHEHKQQALNMSEVGVQIFVRRYTPDSRPWNPFHTGSAITSICTYKFTQSPPFSTPRN